MIKSAQSKMMAFAIILTVCSYMATAAPMDPQTDPSIQDVDSPTFSISSIDYILKPRVADALRMLVSQYKKVASDSDPIVYGNHNPDDKYMSLILKFGKELDTIFENKLEEVVKPVRAQFLIEANKVIHAAKEEARDALTDGVNSAAVIEDLVHALEPVEEALRDLVIDLKINSIPEVMKLCAEASVKAVTDELDSLLDAKMSELSQLGLTVDMAAIREQTITDMNASVPGMVEEFYKSMPNDVYKDKTKVKKLLEQFFLEKVSASMLRSVISGNNE